MAWTNDYGMRSQTRETVLTAGPVFYWLTMVIAALIFVFAVGDFFISWAEGHPIVRVVALITAAVIWLIGHGLRALMS